MKKRKEIVEKIEGMNLSTEKKEILTKFLASTDLFLLVDSFDFRIQINNLFTTKLHPLINDEKTEIYNLTFWVLELEEDWIDFILHTEKYPMMFMCMSFEKKYQELYNQELHYFKEHTKTNSDLPIFGLGNFDRWSTLKAEAESISLEILKVMKIGQKWDQAFTVGIKKEYLKKIEIRTLFIKDIITLISKREEIVRIERKKKNITLYLNRQFRNYKEEIEKALPQANYDLSSLSRYSQNLKFLL